MSDNPSPTLSTGPQAENSQKPIYEGADYKPVPSNWFTAKPYGFRFTPKSGAVKVMYLPIGPSNLNIVTQFATNIIPTIYGTVEEHSPVRYHDITIEGTTGMTPKFVEPVDPSTVQALSGRSAFTVQQSLSTEAKGFLSKTLSTYSTLQNPTERSTAVTGVFLDQTGYLAFHNLFRFFLQYKKDVAGINKEVRKENSAPPLVFFNQKDNNEYSVAIKSFVLRRDKEHPMLYFYSISLRGYDLTDLNSTTSSNKVTTSEELLTNLGLDGVRSSTFLSKAKDIASSTRDMLGSIATGINQLGR